jgi:hypothetical protein
MKNQTCPVIQGQLQGGLLPDSSRLSPVLTVFGFSTSIVFINEPGEANR